MSALAKLTNASEQDVRAVTEELERLSGFTSEDVRLLARHHQDTRRIIFALGLDPEDTTGEELYEVLKTKLASDSKHLARALGYETGDSKTRAMKLAQTARSADSGTEVFSIKKPVAKSLLRANPPLHLMKKLRYRSLESMLKREDICELFAVLPVSETNAWQKKFSKSLATLRASNFEIRNVTYHAMTSDKWQRVFSPARPVSYVPLMGAVTIWPIEILSRPESVCCALAVLQAAELLETDSLYLKNYQFRPQFGKLASQLYVTGEQQPLQVAKKQFFDWHDLKQLLGSESSYYKAFTALHPALSWWKDAQHTVLAGGDVVSTNLSDVLSSLLGDAAFNSRPLQNGAAALRGTLAKKYLAYGNVANYFRAQLDDSSLALAPARAEDNISSELEAGLI